MKTILVGFDAFDPKIFEDLHLQGKTPNLSKLVDSRGYSRFRVTNPPQSEVSWTSIATGMDPGGHGIFDFVHRNPETYSRRVSLLPTKTGIAGRLFVPPFNATTIFDKAVEDGYPAASLWWPATFPARQSSPVKTIPGLGTPDIFGRLGVGISYSLNGDTGRNIKTRTGKLKKTSQDNYSGEIDGPQQMTISGTKDASLDFELKILDQNNSQLFLAKSVVDLDLGKWSPIIELSFKVGFGVSVKAVTRAILTSSSPEPVLYFLPIQLHPLRSPWPYGTPKVLMKKIWKNPGPYLTLGWPQDTTGLEEKFISDEQFLALCDEIFSHRERTLMGLIDTYKEGVLACVFDSLDRIQHMFYRDRMDIIEAWYIKLDTMFGRILDRVQGNSYAEDSNLIIVSDHGFGDFNYKINLNRWLINQGYLAPKSDKGDGNLNQVDWGQSAAYAIGLNSVYLNLEGREGSGVVKLDQVSDQLDFLSSDLLEWRGPDDQPVVKKVWRNPEVFQGPYSEFGPDLVIGYNPGYRASAETGMGDWGTNAFEENTDHWGSDHCFDAETVPGVLFSNRSLSHLNNPSFKDIPMLSIGREIEPAGGISDPIISDEDQDVVDERLKELGYL